MSYRVKCVLSGDVLILSNKNDYSEIQLNLAYVAAPRISEPWGFEAREHLRQLCLAKPVKHSVAYEINGRQYGDISSPVFQSLVHYLLSKGWCKIRSNNDGKPRYSELESQLLASQKEAESKSLGIWSSKQPQHILVRDVVPQDLYGSGRQVPAIVERVLSGDRVIIRAMMDPDDHYVGQALLAGIKCQRPQSGEPTSIGNAAAEILSSRLLQRQSVRVVFLAPAPHNPELPLVNLLHPQGDIALVLAGSGLAEVPNIPQIGADRLLQLKNAQIDAESNGLGMYKAAFESRKQHKQKYINQISEASVIRVLSGDTVILDPGMEMVHLSSIRAPNKNEDADAAHNAREFTRKLLIGQTVRVQVDGETNPHQLPDQTRKLVTLSYGPQFAHNAALTIVKAGWATVARHSKNDHVRSPFYDELLATEQQAKESKIGLYAPTSRAKYNFVQLVDASESTVRAKGYLSALKRKLRIPAIIEHVFSASRLRLIVPSENCSIIIVLDGIQVPRSNDPFADDALRYTLKEWNQRDVEVTVRSVDKTGAFVATLYKKSKSLAHELLTLGLASVHEVSANVSGLRSDYETLQEKAQLEHLGMWADYNSSVENVASENGPESLDSTHTSNETPSSKYENAILSNVTLDCLWLRLGQSDHKYKVLKTDLQRFFGAASNATARTFSKKPRRNDIVVLNDTFERAKIINITRGTTSNYDVFLIDSGEQRTVNDNQILPIPTQFSNMAPLATPLVMRYVHRPVKLYEQQYLDYLKPFISKPLVVLGDIVYTADSKSFQDSLNYRIVADGIASVPESQEQEENAQVALTAQKLVKDCRKGMWEYGDPREDEDM